MVHEAPLVVDVVTIAYGMEELTRFSKLCLEDLLRFATDSIHLPIFKSIHAL